MLHVPGLGVHARGTKVMLDVMSLDELTVEASCRLLHVIDAPAGAAASSSAEQEAQQDEADEADEEALEDVIEAEDLSAESEAEAQAEADTQAEPAPDAGASQEEPAGEGTPDAKENA
jgi:exoribonuclease-2